MQIVKIEKIGYQKVIECLRSGGVIVYPTDTAYALGCDSTNREACEKIFKIKRRESSKTLSLIVSDFSMAENWLEFSKKAKDLADEYWPGALTLVLPIKERHSELVSESTYNKNKILKQVQNDELSALVINNRYSALRVPDNIISRTLSRELGAPIVATSANESGKDACYSMEDVIESLGIRSDDVKYGINAGILSNGDISTIAKVCDNKVDVLREGVIVIPTVV